MVCDRCGGPLDPDVTHPRHRPECPRAEWGIGWDCDCPEVCAGCCQDLGCPLRAEETTMIDPTYTITDRGLITMPIIDLGHDQRIKVYESSAADEAKIWISVVDDIGPAYAHVSLAQAQQVAEQLSWLVVNHRMAEVTP